jgi:hypothetical protein
LISSIFFIKSWMVKIAISSFLLKSTFLKISFFLISFIT